MTKNVMEIPKWVLSSFKKRERRKDNQEIISQTKITEINISILKKMFGKEDTITFLHQIIDRLRDGGM